MTLRNQGTGAFRTTKTTSAGLFRFPDVFPGTYEVSVKASGFKAYTQTDIAVTPDETRDLGAIALEVGGLTQQVTVTAEATPLQTSSAENSALVSGTQLANISLKSRSFFTSMALLPGVVYTGTPASTGNSGAMGSMYYSGTSSSASNYTIDGITANDTGSNSDAKENGNEESIAEVRVVTASYLAEYGRKGGATISVITKRGDQSFHGSLYWDHRGEDLNANNFFNNRSGLARNIYRYNVFGFSVGGPIFIPHMPFFDKTKNKLFFFVAQEYTRNKNPVATQYDQMPTALERQGNFSQSYNTNGALIAITDPTTGHPFPGNIIPTNRLDPTGVAMLNFFPVPNFVPSTPSLVNQQNYAGVGTLDYPRRNNTVRIDIQLTDKLMGYWRYIDEPETSTAPWGKWGNGSNNFVMPTMFTLGRPARGQAFNFVYTFSPTLINEATAGYDYGHIYYNLVDPSLVSRSTMNNVPLWYPNDISETSQQTSREGYPKGFLETAVVPDISFGSIPVNPPTLSLTAPPYEQWAPAYIVSDKITKVWGSHSVKAGIYYEKTEKFATQQNLGSTTFAWTRGAFSFATDANNPYNTGDGFANAALGDFDSYTESTRMVNHDLWFTNVEGFVQDSWRATNRLSIDIGLRVEYLSGITDHNGTVTGFLPSLFSPANVPRLYVPGFNSSGQRVGVDPATGSTVVQGLIGFYVPNTGSTSNGTYIGGQGGHPSGDQNFTNPNLAPRFGFAYDVFGNGKMAIRGGFGISYDRTGTASFWEGEAGPPLEYVPAAYYGNLSTFASAGGYIGPSAITAPLATLKVPSTYNYSLGIQRSLGFSTMIDVSYVANLSRHLEINRPVNNIPAFSEFNPANADPTNTSKPVPDNFFRPYLGYSTITSYEDSGSSNYNSMQVSLRRQFRKGLQFGGAYTWSRLMGYTTPSSYYSTWRARTYGPVSYDRRQTLVFNYVYELPKFSANLGSAGRYLHPVIDGWSVSGITTFTTGAPFTPSLTTSPTVNFTGSSESARPNVVGNPVLPKSQRTLYQAFNVSAFAEPTPCSWTNQTMACFGNLGYDSLYGPGINNWDISVEKRIPVGLGELRTLNFRAEFYNAFNHPQFNALNSTLQYNAAGAQINAAAGQYTGARDPRIIAFNLRLRF